MTKDAAFRSYLYFLRTALFWDRFGQIRDPRHEGKPLLILNTPERVKETDCLPVRPDRQVISIIEVE